ncbi:hypothetical protein HY339_00270 [Candidatus Gottesmanbacteria bacterium]|nr:hypothetical protein [Candidatus Gottesmanbacteria bacterium]
MRRFLFLLAALLLITGSIRNSPGSVLGERKESVSEQTSLSQWIQTMWRGNKDRVKVNTQRTQPTWEFNREGDYEGWVFVEFATFTSMGTGMISGTTKPSPPASPKIKTDNLMISLPQGTKRIQAKLSAIPTPPDGSNVFSFAVTFRYTTASGTTQSLPLVDQGSADGIVREYEAVIPETASVTMRSLELLFSSEKPQQQITVDWIRLISDTPGPSRGSIGCNTGNVVETRKATAAEAGGIAAGLKAIKDGTGVTTVAQAFPSSSTQKDWHVFFDAAENFDMKVIPFFGLEAPPKWNGKSFDLGINETFLKTMKDHPALYAFFLIDEPFHAKHGWNVTTERLQLLYQQAKAIAPNVPMIVQYSREISKAENGGNTKYRFAAGQCDICKISALEFRNYGQGNVFDRDALIANHTVSRRVITRENPTAQLWSTVQVFGSAGGKSSYYMPTSSELQQMVDTLFSDQLQQEGKLDGVSWQAWIAFDTDDAKQLNLSKPQFGAHRTIARSTCGRAR